MITKSGEFGAGIGWLYAPITGGLSERPGFVEPAAEKKKKKQQPALPAPTSTGLRAARLEYMVKRFSVVEIKYDDDGHHFSDLDPDALTIELNVMAADGYRLVNVIEVGVGAARGERLFIFERVK